jgi:hypothetical protein
MKNNVGPRKSRNARKSRKIFCSIAAQHDNLGDIAIRQTAIEWLDDESRKLVIYTGNMPRQYIEAFDLPTSALLISSGRKFAIAFLVACAKRNAHLVFAPGPFQIRPGRRALMKAVANLGNVLMVRASGGRAIAIGRAVRGKAQPGLALERLIISLVDLFIVRDVTSTNAVGRPLRTAPDMAFGQRLAEITVPARPYIAVSLRGDRPTKPELIETLIKMIRTSGHEPIFVTQVMRDNEQHVALAAQFGAELCSWTTESHSHQLRKVDGVYAASEAVISDRLHSLIFGMRRGATPIGLERIGSDKLSSTLGHLVPLTLLDPERDITPGDFALDFGGQMRGDIEESVATAQRVLSSVKRDVRALI